MISDEATLRDAYESIKGKSGNMVKGSDEETLDGITEKWFSDTQGRIREDKFVPRPARRVLIQKKNGKLRPLGISSPRDKIVQQAMRIVMEVVLEPTFKDTSHGFRPGRGCHSALEKVKEWTSVKWFLEGDIKSYFDTIDHSLTERLLSKHFKDPALFRLY